jgi:hypothetical protein
LWTWRIGRCEPDVEFRRWWQVVGVCNNQEAKHDLSIPYSISVRTRIVYLHLSRFVRGVQKCSVAWELSAKTARYEKILYRSNNVEFFNRTFREAIAVTFTLARL